MPTPQEYLGLYEKGLISGELVLQAFQIDKSQFVNAKVQLEYEMMAMQNQPPIPYYPIQIETTTIQADTHLMEDIVLEMILRTANSFF